MEKLAPGGFAHEPTIVVTKSQKKTETMIFCVHDAEANLKLAWSLSPDNNILLTDSPPPGLLLY